MKSAVLTCGLAFVLAWGNIRLACAAEQWQLLVIPEPDGQVNGRREEILKRAETALFSQFDQAGFTVYDRKLSGLPVVADHCDGDACQPQADKVLVDFARKADKLIDAVVIYDVDTVEIKRPAATSWRIRVFGYMLDLETGQRLQDWDDIGREFLLNEAQCQGECLASWLGDKVALSAASVGQTMALRLQQWPRTHSYQLYFSNFSLNEFDPLESALRHRRGEQPTLELQKEHHGRRQWLHQITSKDYRYTTRQGSGSLRALLQSHLDEVGISATITVNPDNDPANPRVFKVVRQGLPYSGRYVMGLLLLLVLACLLWSIRQRHHHQRRLDQLVRKSQPALGLSYLRSIAGLGPLRRKNWLVLEQQWQQDVDFVHRCHRDALALAERREYSQALDKLDQGMSRDSDNRELSAARTQIEHQQQARALLAAATNELTQSPDDAVRRLAQARTLDPALAEQAVKLEQQALALIRQQRVAQALNKGRQALRASQWYLALSLIDSALAAIGEETDFLKEKEQLNQLRRLALPSLPPVKGQIVLHHDGATELYLGERLDIARTADNGLNTLAINYRRLSRGGKQNRIRYRAGEFFIEDLGSSNGSWLRGHPLAMGQARRLTQGSELALGGQRSPMRIGLCVLTLDPCLKAPGALVIRLAPKGLALVEQGALAGDWPTLEPDLHRHWCLLSQELALGVDEQGQLDVGCLSGCRPVVILVRKEQQSLWIRPAKESIDNGVVKLDAELLCGEVPVISGAVLQLFDLKVTFDQI